MTETQQSVKQQNQADWVTAQLHAPDGSRHLSELYQARERFKNDLMSALSTNTAYQGEANKDALNARVQKGLAELDRQVAERAAKAGEGDASAFKENLRKQKAAVSGQVEGVANNIFDMIGGFFGGMGGMLMKGLRMLPGVGAAISRVSDWVSDKISGRTPEQRDRENTAAGIAISLINEPIIVDGVAFTPEVGKLFSQASSVDFNKPIEKPQSVTPTAAAPVIPTQGVTLPDGTLVAPLSTPIAIRNALGAVVAG